MIRVGIIGLGFMGRMHIGAYGKVPGATIVALVLLGQAPPLLALPGMAMVVVGVALVVRASRPTTLVEPAT